MRFSIFDGTYYCTVTDINPNAVPDSDEENPAKGFVYWITVEGKNPGLVQPGIKVQLGLPAANANSGVLWFASSSKVDGFVDEQRVLSTVEAMATQVHVREMQTVKKGDAIVSLSGSDVQKTIQEYLDKIREKESQLAELRMQAGQMEAEHLWMEL